MKIGTGESEAKTETWKRKILCGDDEIHGQEMKTSSKDRARETRMRRGTTNLGLAQEKWRWLASRTEICTGARGKNLSAKDLCAWEWIQDRAPWLCKTEAERRPGDLLHGRKARATPEQTSGWERRVTNEIDRKNDAWQVDQSAEETRADQNPTKKIAARTEPNSMQKSVRPDLVE
jgi:hypothetical protein